MQQLAVKLQELLAQVQLKQQAQGPARLLLGCSWAQQKRGGPVLPGQAHAARLPGRRSCRPDPQE